MVRNLMLECYGLFFKELPSKNGDNSRDSQKDANEIILKWRKLIFLGIFTSFLLFSVVPYILSSYSAVQDRLWANLIIYSVNYFVVGVIVFFRQIPFKIRVFSGLLAIYSLGLIALISLGIESSGRLYLLSWSIIATLLVGIRLGMATILLNAGTLFGVGIFVASGTLAWTADNPSAFRMYAITGVTFLFLNVTPPPPPPPLPFLWLRSFGYLKKI